MKVKITLYAGTVINCIEGTDGKFTVFTEPNFSCLIIATLKEVEEMITKKKSIIVTIEKTP